MGSLVTAQSRESFGTMTLASGSGWVQLHLQATLVFRQVR